MNPINLLTKGRTIRALKERPGRYKLLCDGVLPHFAGSKGQIPTTPHQTAQTGQPALFAQPKPMEESPKQEGKSVFAETSAFARAGMEKTKKEEAITPVHAAPTQPQPSKPGWWSQLATIPAGWVDKWSFWRKTPLSPLENFQTELALEKVKVLRNDLSEDDLEVVLVEQKAGKKAEKPVQSEKVELEKLTAEP